MSDAADRPSGGPTLLERLSGILRPRKPDESLREAIEEIIEEGEAPPAEISAQERTLLRNIFKLRELTAYDVMVPRADIVAVDVEISLPDLVRVIAKEAHSRLPVHRGSLDDIVGMVHIKDVLPFWGGTRAFKLDDIVRKVLFVAPSMHVLDLLLEMRKTRIHMALVVDEYGGIDGLVTIEDLVEEIVGEIEDEHDVDEGPRLVAEPDGSWTADARLPVEEFEAQVAPILTPEEREEDIDTIGGLVVVLAGRVPARGELIRHASGYEFEVLDADPRRLKKIRIHLRPEKALRSAPGPEPSRA
jgi:CBS domain containing-hemolysin-like protein